MDQPWEMFVITKKKTLKNKFKFIFSFDKTFIADNIKRF